MIKKDSIKSLETIRCLAFLGVFFSHSDINSRFLAGSGMWGVSVFLILSGFLAVYNHLDSNDFEDYSISYSFKYAVNKMKKIWPLHLITLFIMVLFEAIGKDRFQLMFLSLKAFLNALLVQEWIPLKGRSINGVTWYLCVTLFSYYITPFFINKMRKKCNVKKAFVSIAVLFGLQIILGYIGSLLPTPYEIDFIDYDLCNWFVYKFPLVRIIDYIIGCFLGYIFINVKDKNIVRCNLFEIISIVVVVISSTVLGYLRYLTVINGGDQTVANNMWWGYTIIFTINTCLLVYYFAINKGILSKLLTNKVTSYISKISSYAYLIHNVVNRFLLFAVQHSSNEYYSYYLWLLKITIGLLITLILSELWRRFVSTKKRPISN